VFRQKRTTLSVESTPAARRFAATVGYFGGAK
jgi:hypothetical protein